MTWFDIGVNRGMRSASDKPRIAVEKNSLRIILGDNPLTQLGWGHGLRVTVLEGRGESAGFIRLVKVAPPAGWMLQFAGGRGKSKPGQIALKMAARLRGAPTLTGMPERLPATPAEYQIIDGMLELKLPWAVGERKSEPVEPVLAPKAAPADAVSTAESVAILPAGVARPSTTTAADREGGDSDRYRDTRAQPADPPPSSAAASVNARPAATKIGLITNNPATWVPEVHARFEEAVKRGAPASELARICGRPIGSIADIIKRYLPHLVEPRQIAVLARLEAANRPPEENRRLLASGAALAGGESATPALNERLLRFLRDEVDPVLKPLGHKLGKSDDGTELLWNGKPTTAADLVAEANRILRDWGENQLIELPDFVAA